MLHQDTACSSSGRIVRFRAFAGTFRGMLLLTLAFVVVAYLVLARPAALVALLPFGMLLLCPLLHVFMHRGHGGQSGHSH